MNVGIGLPTTVPGVAAVTLLNWAREAEAASFFSLGVVDRLVYSNDEPLVTLAAAAAVTTRIRLITAILLAPLHTNTALLAKQVATVDHLSGGRLTLGVGVGWQAENYTASGANFTRRGRTLDRQLPELKRLWHEAQQGVAGSIGPAPVQPGGPPEQFKTNAATVRNAWAAAGRDDIPHLAGLAYFALGPDAASVASAYLGAFYAPAGPAFVERSIAGAATTPEAVRSYIKGYADAGCNELLFFPCSADPRQVDLLASAMSGT